MATIEFIGAKCANQHHFHDAERNVGCPATDSYTMNVRYDDRTNIVHMECMWCGYVNDINVSERPIQIRTFLNGWVTVGPTIK